MTALFYDHADALKNKATAIRNGGLPVEEPSDVAAVKYACQLLTEASSIIRSVGKTRSMRANLQAYSSGQIVSAVIAADMDKLNTRIAELEGEAELKSRP